MIVELEGEIQGRGQPVRGRINLRLLLRQCRYQGFGLEKCWIRRDGMMVHG